MPTKVTHEQRHAVLNTLAHGQDRDTIATAVGVTPGPVSAIAAHVTMGTYALLVSEGPSLDGIHEVMESTSNLFRMLQGLEGAPGRATRLSPILLGSDAETGEEVFWNPDPGSGAASPHILILGESGFGKTYTIASRSAELARENLFSVVSVVFDYGQGFFPATLPPE